MKLPQTTTNCLNRRGGFIPRYRCGDSRETYTIPKCDGGLYVGFAHREVVLGDPTGPTNLHDGFVFIGCGFLVGVSIPLNHFIEQVFGAVLTVPGYRGDRCELADR